MPRRLFMLVTGTVMLNLKSTGIGVKSTIRAEIKDILVTPLHALPPFFDSFRCQLLRVVCSKNKIWQSGWGGALPVPALRLLDRSEKRRRSCSAPALDPHSSTWRCSVNYMSLRRTTPASPRMPAPNRPSVLGSGTGV